MPRLQLVPPTNIVNASLAGMFAIAVVGCQTVAPNYRDSGYPALAVRYTDRLAGTGPTDITGTPSQPGIYKNVYDDSAATQFDGIIGVDASDAGGMHTLGITYTFVTCFNQGTPTGAYLPITSLNNGATTWPGSVYLDTTSDLNSSGQVPTDLGWEVHITTADLQKLTCPSGQPSDGFGTIVLHVDARNWAYTIGNDTQGTFEIKIGPGPLPMGRLVGDHRQAARGMLSGSPSSR